MTPEILIHQALSSEIGIVVSTSNPRYAMKKLRDASHAIGVADKLIISYGRKDTTLLFIRKSSIPLPPPEIAYAEGN